MGQRTSVEYLLERLRSASNALENHLRVNPSPQLEKAIESLRNTIDWLEEYIDTLERNA